MAKSKTRLYCNLCKKEITSGIVCVNRDSETGRPIAFYHKACGLKVMNGDWD